MRYTLIIIFLLISSGAFTQSTCDSLVMLKAKLYGFTPGSISDSLRELKSKELDIFWYTAIRNKKEAAPCVNDLILNETKDPYFCYDASALLLQLDTTGKYLPTVIQGFEKCNIEDMQLYPYLSVCVFLGSKGYDIKELAFKLISAPNVRIFLPEHFFTLDAIESGIFLMNTMPGNDAESFLFSTIDKGNPTAKHNALVLLDLLSTDRGDSLINFLTDTKQIADSTLAFIRTDRDTLPAECDNLAGRDEVLVALGDVPYNFEKEFFGFAGNDRLICSACKQLTKADIQTLRDARQKSTPGLSDEALDEYLTLTKVLMTVRYRNAK